MEYKFRFWVEAAKKMADWETAKKECNRLSLLEMPGFIPMLFTGIKDKNGIELYQNDICNVDLGFVGKLHLLIYDQDNCAFKWQLKEHLTAANWRPLFDDLRTINYFPKGDTIEIIGNIYSNPELLNQK